jgi:hypothetical protein
MISESKSIDVAEAWENGDLGRSEEHASLCAEDFSRQIDVMAGLEILSVRLDSTLVGDLKAIAALEGINHTALVRRVLQRFATAELKKLAREYMEYMEAQREASKIDAEPPTHQTKCA